MTANFAQITARPLSESELRHRAPSIFATEAHASRSDRFAPIPTWELVQRIMAAGFVPVDARQSRTRDESKIAFTKHLIRFRPADAGALAVGDTVPECLLINGNDGSSAYKTLSAMTRLICLNGMTIPTRTDSEFSIPHKGRDVAARVIEATFETVNTATRALEAPREWSRIELSRDDQMALAEASHTVRFADASGNVDTPITAEQLLRPRRYDDNGPDLWKTFNRIQENATKGGLRAVRVDPETRRRRRVSTRAVNGIDGDVKLNQALWTLAEKMAELKG